MLDSVFLYCATRREGQCATENGNCLFCAISAITIDRYKTPCPVSMYEIPVAHCIQSLHLRQHFLYFLLFSWHK